MPLKEGGLQVKETRKGEEFNNTGYLSWDLLAMVLKCHFSVSEFNMYCLKFMDLSISCQIQFYIHMLKLLQLFIKLIDTAFVVSSDLVF